MHIETNILHLPCRSRCCCTAQGHLHNCQVYRPTQGCPYEIIKVLKLRFSQEEDGARYQFTSCYANLHWTVRAAIRASEVPGGLPPYGTLRELLAALVMQIKCGTSENFLQGNNLYCENRNTSWITTYKSCFCKIYSYYK